MPIYEDETKRREGRSFFSPSTASKRAKFLSLSLSHSAAIRFRDRGEGHEIEWRKRRRRGGSKMSAASGRRDRSSRRGSHALAPLLAVRWMRRRVPSEPPPACPSDWGRRSSLPPPYSSCPSASSSTAIPLSGWMNYASFLVTIMGLLIPWSCTLAMFDIYSAFSGCSLRLPGLMVIVVVGDMVLSILSLAAASASAGVIDLLLHIDGNYCPPKFCGRYQLSTAMAFLAWFLSAASCLFNLWLVASW